MASIYRINFPLSCLEGEFRGWCILENTQTVVPWTQASKYMKNAQHHKPLEKCTLRSQWNITVPIRMAKINNDDTKCWQECKRAKSFIHCRWQYKIVKPLWTVVWHFFSKTKNGLITRKLYSWTYIPEKWNLFLCSNLYISVHSFIHNGPKLETIQRSFNRRMWYVHPHLTILLNGKKGTNYWYMQQLGWTSRKLYQVGKASLKKIYTAWSHL